MQATSKEFVEVIMLVGHLETLNAGVFFVCLFVVVVFFFS